MGSNPTDMISKLDEERDRRYERRSLTDLELRSLLTRAKARGRLAWYLLAHWAGLRRSELKGLKWGDLDLERAVLTVKEGKAHRVDEVPLHPELVEELLRIKPSLAHPTSRVFLTAVTTQTRRRDFVKAGIVLVDEHGRRADLHAMRGTLATMLARSGVAPQVGQKVMRHKDYRTTQKYYEFLDGSDTLAAMEGLSGILSAPGNSNQRATGTAGLDHQQKHQQSVHDSVRKGAKQRDSDDGGERGKVSVVPLINAVTAAFMGPQPALAMVRPPGLEPGTAGLEIRCSIQLSYGRALVSWQSLALRSRWRLV
jgi:hypothetical protein